MPSRGVILVTVAVLTLVVAPPAAAMEMRAGPSARIAQGEVIDDDLYLAASWVSMAGTVRGDVIAAGGYVDVGGQVRGDLLAAGGTLDVGGSIGATVRAMGGTLAIRGPVGGDLVVAGGTVVLAPSARVGRDIAVGAGSLSVMGTVGRNVVVGGGRVEIGGTVNGNVTIRGGEIILLPSAVIRGGLTYSSDREAAIASGARVGGQVVRQPYPVRPMPSRQAVRGLRIAFAFVDFFWMLVLALVLVAVTPASLQLSADVIRTRPWASLGWGALLLIGIPLAALLLFIMVIGIPISVLLLMAHLLALFVSHAAVGLAIGQTVAPRLRSPYGEVALGVAIVVIATNLPYVGWLLRLVAVAFGLGALILALWARRGGPTQYRPAPAVLS